MIIEYVMTFPFFLFLWLIAFDRYLFSLPAFLTDSLSHIRVAFCLESKFKSACAEILWAYSSSKSYCMVSPCSWTSCIRGRNCRPMYSFLEYNHKLTLELHWYWKSGNLLLIFCFYHVDFLFHWVWYTHTIGESFFLVVFSLSCLKDIELKDDLLFLFLSWSLRRGVIFINLKWFVKLTYITISILSHDAETKWYHETIVLLSRMLLYTILRDNCKKLMPEGCSSLAISFLHLLALNVCLTFFW
jgi:hypothetical protein